MPIAHRDADLPHGNDLLARDIGDEIDHAFDAGLVVPEREITKIDLGTHSVLDDAAPDDGFPEITTVDSEDEDSKALDKEVDRAFDDLRTRDRLGERKKK